MKRLRIFGLICLGAMLITACKTAAPAPTEAYLTTVEHPVTYVELAGPVAAASAEVSAMAWCGDQLILVPQYPSLFINDGQASVFAIPKTMLEAYLSGTSTDPIKPVMIPVDLGDLLDEIDGYEGFEAITFYREDVYLTIESHVWNDMVGYLVRGSVVGDCEGITLDSESAVAIHPQAHLSNLTDETIIVYDERILTVYEANGFIVNPDPVAHEFTLGLEPMGETPFPNIDYRVTDATVPNADGLFWVINYFYPGDTDLKPHIDEIAVEYGLGESHKEMEQVERLVALQITDEGIAFAGIAPIYLELDPSYNDARNWEGLVQFGEGFLLVTDEYPTTILGYVGR